jgi:transposase
MAFAAATHSRDLTDEQWALIGGFLPEPVRRADGPGRPWRENRAVLNGILWILRKHRGLTCRTAIRRIKPATGDFSSGSASEDPDTATQDGHPLRRYQRRWKVERLSAWFQDFRRIVVRYERLAENFLGMLHLASCLILLRGL